MKASLTSLGLALALVSGACGGDSSSSTTGGTGGVGGTDGTTPWVWDLPRDLVPLPRVPEDNPMTVEKVELGHERRPH